MKEIIKRRRITIYLPLLLGLFLMIGSCKKDNVEPKDTQPEANFNLDEGSIGIVIDTREIFRKGYKPVHAQVSFQNFSAYNTTLDVDSVTCIAKFDLENKSLTESEKTAFTNGVPVSIDIYNGVGTLLTNYSDNKLEVDDSNKPIILSTEKPYIIRPLKLKEGVPYLLQLEDTDGLLTSTSSDGYLIKDYVNDNPDQQFYFIPAGDDDTYLIDHYGYSEGTHMALEEKYQFFILAGDFVPLPADGPTKFVFEQDDDGWIRMRIQNTNKHVYLRDSKGYELLADTSGKYSRFRIISDNINWHVEDRGTHYNQPIISPVKLDFAYNATLKNCSSAALTEEVGKSESKSRTTTMSTSEGLQLFSSETDKIGIKVGVEVSAKVGADLDGVAEASEEVKVSEELSYDYTYTTSQTKTTENTWSESTTTTDAVSRVRTLALNPYSAVEVYDAIKSVDNVITPFTQVLRITGDYKKNGQALTGPELVTQMRFNLVGGIVTTVADKYIEVTLRGHSTMDELFKAVTEVYEIPGACDN